MLILSDHGFCNLKKKVYVNEWLGREGYLKPPQEKDRNWEIVDVMPGMLQRLGVDVPWGLDGGAGTDSQNP